MHFDEMSKHSAPQGVAILDLSIHSNQAHSNMRSGLALVVIGLVLLVPTVIGIIFLESELIICSAPCSLVFLLTGIAMCLVAWPAIRSAKGTVRNAETYSHIAQPLADLQWPVERSGAKPRKTAEIAAVAEQGIRVVADSRLESWLITQEIRAALLEPVAITASRPVSTGNVVLATILQACLCIILVPAVFVLGGLTVNELFGAFLALTVIVLLFWRTLSQLLIVQRMIGPIPGLGRLVRPKIGRGGLVVGPGWARSGKVVWHARRDLMLIRRVQGLRTGAGIQLMLAGSPGCMCFTLAGTKDPMLDVVWQAWMHPEPRPELAMSDLSMSTR